MFWQIVGRVRDQIGQTASEWISFNAEIYTRNWTKIIKLLNVSCHEIKIRSRELDSKMNKDYQIVKWLGSWDLNTIKRFKHENNPRSSNY